MAGGNESDLSGKLLFCHERVSIIRRWRKSLLYRPGADPAHQVHLRSGLVVGPRPAGTAKGLLADYGSGRFVVDVEVAGGVAEVERGFADRAAVLEASDVLRNAAGNFYINDKPTGAVVGQQPFGGARASGTNDKAGSKINLLRWVSARTIKETLSPPRDYKYPYMSEP